MYYKCKIYPSSAIVYVREENLDVIVSYFTSVKDSLLIIDYLTDDEVNVETHNCFVELKCMR